VSSALAASRLEHRHAYDQNRSRNRPQSGS